MAFRTTSAFYPEKYIQDFEDRFTMLCIKKILKNPLEERNDDFTSDVLTCKHNLINIYRNIAPTIFRGLSKKAQEPAAEKEESEE